ncbi:MAG: succinate dehydrogenase assembly factor 2 [Pseudomonadota bacterium]
MRELRNPNETPEHRLKRLRLRSWRRGIKEMDLILGAYADARLAELDATTLDAYEALLDENDQDLYKWVSGAEARPDVHTAMLADISAFHGIES